MKRRTLRSQLSTWLAVYLVLMTGVVFAAANYVHERAEHAVWRALLNSELDTIVQHLRGSKSYRWQDAENLHFFIENQGEGFPAGIAALSPGLHDGPFLQSGHSAVMVRQTPDFGRVALVMDIGDFAALEGFITRWAMLAGIAMALVTLVMAWWGMAKLIRPATRLAEDISGLSPERAGQRVVLGRHGSAELEVIAGALNDYLERNERFVERERVFIRTASHELRTPIAVITGAAELGLEQPGVPARAHQQLSRIKHTAMGVEQLIQLLLVLARDPQRLMERSEHLALEDLLPETVDDHRHLAAGKELQVQLAPTPLPACSLQAPMGVVQAAVGNVLRNAIENSDRGVIEVGLSAQGVVTIEDPGHRMAPEEVAALYAKAARGERTERTGIGMELISRLCDHLGWALGVEAAGNGTRVTLDMSASLPRRGGSTAG